jgi:hypothetical protein
MLNLAILGLRPLLSAFVLVELIALAVPRLRWRRHDPRGRVALGQAVAALALGLAAIQGYFISLACEQMQGVDAGIPFRLTMTVTLAAATAVFALVAGFVRERGLGNGYGALLASGVLLDLGAALLRQDIDVVGLAPRAPVWSALPEALALIAIAALTALVLRWQTGGGADRPPLQAPSAGDSPLSSALGLLAVLSLLSTVGLGESVAPLGTWLNGYLSDTGMILLLGLAAAPLWSWLLARPSLVAARASRAGLTPPTLADWRRATLVSMALVLGVTLLRAAAAAATTTTSLLVDSLALMVATAAVLDLIDDARARRAPLVAVAVLHQVQRAALVEHVLARAGIPCHLHARHLRALTTFFGPYAPIIVLVPAEAAEAARQLLDEEDLPDAPPRAHARADG